MMLFTLVFAYICRPRKIASLLVVVLGILMCIFKLPNLLRVNFKFRNIKKGPLQQCISIYSSPMLNGIILINIISIYIVNPATWCYNICFKQSNLSICSFMDFTFHIVSKKSLPTQGHKEFLLPFLLEVL